MTPADRLARVEALLAELRRERGLCDCARRLAEAMGDPCERCEGSGTVSEPAGYSRHMLPRLCPDCRGSGVRTEVRA